MMTIVGPMTMAELCVAAGCYDADITGSKTGLFLGTNGVDHVPITCPMIAQPLSTVGSRHTTLNVSNLCFSVPCTVQKSFNQLFIQECLRTNVNR
jgi:hypothetical protein